jgi:hypothetical protein
VSLDDASEDEAVAADAESPGDEETPDNPK